MWVTGLCSCSQQHQPILETSRKVKFLANFLCLGQSWPLCRAVGKEENGKGPCYVWAHELDVTCPSEQEPHLPPWLNQGNCPKSPTLTRALKSHWFPNYFLFCFVLELALFSPILLAGGQVLCGSYKIRKLTLNSHLQLYSLPNTGCLARISFFFP